MPKITEISIQSKNKNRCNLFVDGVFFAGVSLQTVMENRLKKDQEVEEEQEDVEEIPDYPVTLFFTQEGYFKKITPLSLRMSGEHKLKENDKIVATEELEFDLNENA